MATLSADERKLLRKIVQERAERARKRLSQRQTEEISAVIAEVEIAALPPTDPRRLDAEAFNVAVETIKKLTKKGEVADASYYARNAEFLKTIDRYSKAEQERLKTEINEKYRGLFAKVEEAEDVALMQAVAGGLADGYLKEFTEKLEKLTAEG